MGWFLLPLPLGQNSMSWAWQMTHKAGIHMELAPERGEKKSLINRCFGKFPSAIALVDVAFRIINYLR